MPLDSKHLIRVYLDDQNEPIVTYRPPVRFELDTTQLEDGNHRLRIEADDATGSQGIRTIPFEVRNGPGIGIDGLQDHDCVEGKIPILVNAYGSAGERYWEPERAETPAPIPTWAWILLITIVAWSIFYFARQWNTPPEFASSPTYSMFAGSPSTASAISEAVSKSSAGAALYRTSCASCHQGNGEGVPGVFPPLSGDPVVTAQDPTRHIEIILYGLQGESIEGVDYAAAMPPFSRQLSNEEVAAIINHERTSWGNNAPTVTEEDVQNIRVQGRRDE
jgi:mono/diheme cytochrome c family protein